MNKLLFFAIFLLLAAIFNIYTGVLEVKKWNELKKSKEQAIIDNKSNIIIDELTKVIELHKNAYIFSFIVSGITILTIIALLVYIFIYKK